MTRKRTIDWLLKNYMPFLKKFGMDEKNIRENYTNNWKIKKGDNVFDYLYSIFNLLLDENYKQTYTSDLEGYYNRNREIYSEMARFQVKYRKKPATHLQKLQNENYIKGKYESLKDSTIQCDVMILTGGSDCKYGNEINEKLISIEEALENSSIPYDKCTNDLGCFCFYGILPRRDEDGNLIFKDEHKSNKNSKKKKSFWNRLFS